MTMDLIKNLRDKTGAGILDCKKALSETNNNIEEAVDWLRKKGLSSAGKKSSRVTAEGLVAVEHNDDSIILLEVNAETDFVAKNDSFQGFVKNIAKLALKSDGTIESLKAMKYDNDRTVEEELVNLIATIGENLTIRRLQKFSTSGKYASFYIHGAINANLGKIAVVSIFDKEPKQAEVAKQLGMHIVANKPQSLSIESLDPAIVTREMDIQKELAKQSGKPDSIIEKMLEGRLSKFYQEIVLLEQAFVINPDLTVAKVLKENNCNVLEYSLFIVGDGIEKQVTDFAAEVQSMAKV